MYQQRQSLPTRTSRVLHSQPLLTGFGFRVVADYFGVLDWRVFLPSNDGEARIQDQSHRRACP
jgi:hypothetical protein